MRFKKIDSNLFIQNRQRFARQMRSDSLAIFQTNDKMPRNGDQYFPFRQNSDFFYLTGIDQPESVLLLYPDASREDHREILFIKKGDALSEIWEGQRYTKKEARDISGIQKVMWLQQLPGIQQNLIHQAKRIYVNENENLSVQAEIQTRDIRIAKEIKERYPFHKYHRSQPILRYLRMIKSHPEIELINHAAGITSQAFHRVLKAVKPGMKEYEIEAEIIHTFIAHGSAGHAYDPIVASGASSCVLHYIKNDQVCDNGDILLLDFGAEYGHYAADLSRTIPVNGKFTSRQRDVYQAVLRVLKQTIELMVPGMTLDELNKEVGLMISHELVALDLIDRKDLKEKGEYAAYRQYFMHGVAHHLGLDVHDLSDRNSPFQAGMILTCEPGIYIAEESLGIRLENNILITDNGPVDLMAEIPIEVDHIESLMQEMVLN